MPASTERLLQSPDRKAVVTPVTLRPYFESDETLKELGGLELSLPPHRRRPGPVGAARARRTDLRPGAAARVGERRAQSRRRCYGHLGDRGAARADRTGRSRALQRCRRGGVQSEAQNFSTATRTAIAAIEKALSSGGHISGKTTGSNATESGGKIMYCWCCE